MPSEWRLTRAEWEAAVVQSGRTSDAQARKLMAAMWPHIEVLRDAAGLLEGDHECYPGHCARSDYSRKAIAALDALHRGVLGQEESHA